MDTIKNLINGVVDYLIIESEKNGCAIDYHLSMENGELLFSTDQLPDEDDEYDVYFSDLSDSGIMEVLKYINK